MKIKCYLFAIALLLSMSAGASAMCTGQENYSLIIDKDTSIVHYRNSYWIELGPGLSSRDLAFNASLNLEMTKRWIVSITSENVISADPFLGSPSFLGSPYFDSGFDFSAVNLKLGKAAKGKDGLIVFSGGLSILKGTRYSSTAELGTTSGFGAAFDIKFLLAMNFIGISLNPFFNINQLESYAGVTINIALGQVNYIK